MTPEEIAAYVLRVMQSTADEQTDGASIDEAVAFLDQTAAATIKKLRKMRSDIKHSEPWEGRENQ